MKQKIKNEIKLLSNKKSRLTNKIQLAKIKKDIDATYLLKEELHEVNLEIDDLLDELFQYLC